MELNRIFGVASVLAGTIGLTACGTPPISQRVNTTRHVQAVTGESVAIDRCADNGFHVAMADQYNVAQVNGGGRRHNPYDSASRLLGIFGSSGVSSQMIYTGAGPLIVQYPSSIGVRSEEFDKVVGAVAGAALGKAVGVGKAVGAVIGFELLAPVFGAASDWATLPYKRDKLIKLAECTSDLYALYGGAVPNPAGRGYYYGPATPRSRN